MLSNLEVHRSSSKLHLKSSSVFPRSKSTTTFGHMKSALNNHFQNNFEKKNSSTIRPISAVRMGNKSKNVSGTPLKKLHLGTVAKPNYIASHEVRHNPWRAQKPIHENIISQKGLLEVINMGFLPKNIDFTQLLNHKYEIRGEQKQQENKKEVQGFFPTNPQLPQEMEDQGKKQELDTEREKQVQSKQKKKKHKKMKSFKSKSKKEEEPIIIIPKKKVVLKILNQHIDKNQEYHEYLKKMKLEGNDVALKQYIKKMEQFAKKYRLKKFQFYPVIDETKKISDIFLYRQIVNYQIIGIYKAMQGNRRDYIHDLFKMVADRFLYKKSLRDLCKAENIKRFFKIKKYFETMAVKRTEFLKFKLGVFAENQRRFMEEQPTQFRTQVHIIALNTNNVSHQKSFYKYRQRNNIQLTRIFTTKPQNLIFLLNQTQLNLQPWIKSVQQIPDYHPKIEVIYTNLPKYEVKNLDEIYYGLRKQKVNRIKYLTKNQQSILVPSSFNLAVTKICEALSISLLGSNFVSGDLNKLLNDEEEVNKEAEKLFQKNQIERKKVKQINKYKLINKCFQDKKHNKQIFQKYSFHTPFALLHDKTQTNQIFFQNLSEMIISQKNIHTWVFKLTRERFSRGLAFLQTDTIKILKQKKKKDFIDGKDIIQVSKFMGAILLDKLFLPQSSLCDRIQFLQLFLNEGGYVEAYIEDCSSPCIFGKIQFSGQFKFLGTYNKLYTNQKVNCAAFYPASQITPKLLQRVEEICKIFRKDYQFFGYITFEFLFEKRFQQFYFIDIIPSLEQYSSLYWMYSSYFSLESFPHQQMKVLQNFQKLKKNQIIPFNSLPKTILYCPFIDNNGNKFQNFSDFEEVCLNKKLFLNLKTLEGIKFLYLNLHEQVPDCLSVFCLGSDERSALKFCLEGLNFLIETGNKINKFDKKAAISSKIDCLYINDIIWKFRQMKKGYERKSANIKF